MADAAAAQTAVAVTHSVYEWMQIIGLGAMVGAGGQGVRAVVGLKKVNDQAAEQNLDSRDLFAASRILFSLMLGAIAGGFAGLGAIVDIDKTELAQLFTVAAAGYAGADFIEGLTSRLTGKTPEAGKDAATGGSTPATPGGAAADGSLG